MPKPKMTREERDRRIHDAYKFLLSKRAAPAPAKGG